MRDPRSGRYLASVTSWFYGPKIWIADDPAGDWDQAEGIELPEGGEDSLKRIWVIVAGEEDGVLYAGGDPGSSSRAVTAAPPGRSTKACGISPHGRSGHRRRRPLPAHDRALAGRSERLLVAISAVGIWLSEDGGTTWAHGNEGLVARYVPEESREGTLDLCVHDVRRSPARPERLFMQFHDGVYRSDDGGT